MIIKHTRILLFLLFLVNSQWSFGQVSGISYTISPAAEYTWWDDKAGLDNSLLVGGKLGFGFGEFLELRGLYMRALKQKTNFSDFGLPNYSDSLFVEREVKLTRWGGELKANLRSGNWIPFLTLGTGVQSIKLDTFATNKNIYVSLGAGIALSLADRYTFTLEGKNTPFNFNSAGYLLTPEDKEAFGISNNVFTGNQLKNNWSLHASLQFYIGGRRPGELTELDKAYMATFSDGLRGLRIPIEPTLAKINFDNNLAYRDTWLLGGYAGLDFNDYIGVRAFYFRAMDNNKINSNFDALAMYGGEMRMKLNAARGLTPYLSIGGGYLDVDEKKYEARDGFQANSQAFASGGVGISLPLTKRFNVFGGARAILTSGTNAEEIQSTDQIQTSTMYTVGMRFILGKKADPNAVYQANVQVETDSALTRQQAINDKNAAKLKRDYQAKIVEIEKRLNEAYAQQDLEKAATLLKEKEDAEKIVAELEKRELKKNAAMVIKDETSTITTQQPTTGTSIMPSSGRIQMSAAEFQNLIEEIMENMDSTYPNYSNQPVPNTNYQTPAPQQDLDRRLSNIEQLLVQMASGQKNINNNTPSNPATPENALNTDRELLEKLLLELQKVNQQVAQNNQEIQQLKKAESAAVKRQTEPSKSADGSMDKSKATGVEAPQTVAPGDTLNVVAPSTNLLPAIDTIQSVPVIKE